MLNTGLPVWKIAEGLTINIELFNLLIIQEHTVKKIKQLYKLRNGLCLIVKSILYQTILSLEKRNTH